MTRVRKGQDWDEVIFHELVVLGIVQGHGVQAYTSIGQYEGQIEFLNNKYRHWCLIFEIEWLEYQ